jgi:hypothetical protein
LRGPLRENALNPFPVEDTLEDEQGSRHLPCGISTGISFTVRKRPDPDDEDEWRVKAKRPGWSLP